MYKVACMHQYGFSPPGFVSHYPKLVCQLRKVIYGLKQEPRSWFSKLTTTLFKLGFTSTMSDTYVFTKFTSSYTMFLLVYVNDIIITTSSSTIVTNLISTLSSFFALKGLGNLHHFLGIQVSQVEVTTEDKYAPCKISLYSYLLSASTKFIWTFPWSYSIQVSCWCTSVYTCNMSDLSYYVNCVCHFMHDPKLHRWEAIKQIVRYLIGAIHHGLLLLYHSSLSIIGF